MTKSKFTPGPYRVIGPCEEPRGSCMVFAGDTYLGTAANSDMSPKEIAANAELWADAPRMLEVLRTLCYGTKPILHTEDTLDGYRQAREMLQKHGG